jgi:hypothetical protein
MMLLACSREKEVKELVERGQWPVAEATAPDLHAHISGCRSCRELALVASAFQRARTEAADAAKIGAPSVLWWRAQLRQRNAAVERIGRPILGAQIFALAINLLLAVGVAVWQARHGFAWLTRLQQAPQAATQYSDLQLSQWLGSLWYSALPNSGWNWMVLLSAGATLVLLGGAAVYLASERQ